ncbi:MAG: late competence development ComFB family protein [Prochlorotrichaceae cyanobacterium]
MNYSKRDRQGASWSKTFPSLPVQRIKNLSEINMLPQETLPQQLTYTNVLEALVEQEVERQIRALPLQIRRFVRSIEVLTYALNRLTPLYACSEKGIRAQRQKAVSLYGQQIAQVVTWGIRAVQKDPLRRFHPLKKEPVRTPEELAALASVRSLLQDDTVTWDTLEERIHSIRQATAAKRREAHQDSQFSDPLQSKPQSQLQAVSWKEYKNRRAASEKHNIHLNRSTSGAAGNLRLMG